MTTVPLTMAAKAAAVAAGDFRTLDVFDMNDAACRFRPLRVDLARYVWSTLSSRMASRLCTDAARHALCFACEEEECMAWVDFGSEEAANHVAHRRVFVIRRPALAATQCLTCGEHECIPRGMPRAVCAAGHTTCQACAAPGSRCAKCGAATVPMDAAKIKDMDAIAASAFYADGAGAGGRLKRYVPIA